MSSLWPAGFEKESRLRISTVGRKTGRKHDVWIWFVVDKNGRLLISTADNRRDWVRNALKTGSVDVTIRAVTHTMVITRLVSEADMREVNDLYARKYLLMRISKVFTSLTRRGLSHYAAFELKPAETDPSSVS